jgi:orotate phosphoribosyltransferase
MQDHIARLLQQRQGHFVFESGHHGATWLDLELLFWRPERVQPFAAALAERIGVHGPEAVCGPLQEGAFLALLVALHLRLPFSYTSPERGPASVEYPIPALPGSKLNGKRVAIVDDVINAGSAVGATIRSLTQAGARPVAIGALAVYGDSANRLAAANHAALEALAVYPNRIWEPANCPLCAQGMPLTPGDSGAMRT